MALSIDEIVRIYRTAGTAQYGMEAISQERHALQCGQLAEQAASPPALIAAALLHDLGHLLASLEKPADAAPGDPVRDDLHEFAAVPFLRGVFPDAVIEPIRLHVAAKRYLCSVDPGYAGQLSPASQRSLSLQGGAFSAAEAARFSSRPFSADAIALRRWDDCAKSPTAITPGWGHYRSVLEVARIASSS